MKRILKIILVTAAAAALFLTCLVGAAHLYLLTDQGSRFLLDTVNTLYPGRISGSRIEASLISQEVSLQDAVLKGPDGKLVLKAKHVYLKMDLLALIGYEVIFRKITAEGLHFVLELDKDDRLNIESAFVEDTPEVSPFNVYIHELNCKGLRFEYHGRDGRPVARLENFDLLMKSAFETDTSIALSIPKADLSLFVGDTRIDLGNASASCSIFNDRISDIRISTRKGTSTASLTGSITDMAKKAQLLCSLDMDVDAADIRGSLGLVPEETGRIAGRITATHDYDDPELGISLHYSGGRLMGIPLSRTDLDGTITRRVAEIRRLHAGYASGTLRCTGTVDMRQVFPEGYFEGIKEEDALAYDLSITGTSLLMDDLPGMPQGLRGKMSPKVALKGSGISGTSLRMQMVFEAECTGVHAPQLFRNDDLHLAGSLSYGREILGISSLKARTLGLAADAQGRMNLATKDLDGTLDITSADVRGFFRRLDMDASGSLKASLKLSGNLNRPAAAVRAHSDAARIGAVTLGSIDLDASMGPDGRLGVSSCFLENRASSIRASGVVQVFRGFPVLASNPQLEINAWLEHVDPQDFFRDLPVSGTLSGTVDAQGTMDTLEADIRLSGKDLSYEGVELGRAELDAVLRDGLLSVSRLDLFQKSSRVFLSGDAALYDTDLKRLNKDPEIHLRAQGEDLRMEDFTDKVKGVLSFNASMEGSLFHPIGDAQIRAKDIDAGFQKFTGFDAKIQADGGRFWIDPAILSIAPGETVNGSGWVSIDGKYFISVGTQGLSLEHIDFMKQTASTKGLLFVSASGEGSLSNPTIGGRMSATNILFDNRPLDDMTFSFELADQTITMQGNWNFSLNARHDLSTGDFSGTFIFAETELNPYFVIYGRPNFSGRLTGRVDARGNTASLNTIALAADIASIDILHAQKVLLQGRNLSGSCKDGLVLIPQSRLVFGETGWLDIQGAGHLGKSLTLDTEGVIPVGALGLFYEDLSDSSGLLRVSSQTTTQGGSAATSGLFTLEDIAYTIPENGQRLHSLNGKIRLEGDRFFLEDLAGRLDTGSFRMGGQVAHKDFLPVSFDLKAEAKALPLAIPDMMDLTLDAQASLVTTASRSLLKSDVIILDGVYYKDVQANLLTGVLDRIIPKKKAPAVQARGPEWDFLKDLDLDVSIKRRGEMKVENNISDLWLNPDLRITGSAHKPVVTGRITVTEGTVTFQNNEFSVSRGVVDFLDPYRTVPTVDIKGSTRVRDWSIDLTLEGELDNLEIKLDSSPPEEPADILSLLIVGKTSRELTQGTSGVTVSPGAMAAEMLTSTYGGELKKATTLDIFEFKASEFSTTDAGQNLTLTLGKELSRKMTLRYQVETRNAETIQRGIAEYKILENLIVNGYQGSDGIFGAEMQLKYEFR